MSLSYISTVAADEVGEEESSSKPWTEILEAIESITDKISTKTHN